MTHDMWEVTFDRWYLTDDTWPLSRKPGDTWQMTDDTGPVSRKLSLVKENISPKQFIIIYFSKFWSYNDVYHKGPFTYHVSFRGGGGTIKITNISYFAFYGPIRLKIGQMCGFLQEITHTKSFVTSCWHFHLPIEALKLL